MTRRERLLATLQGETVDRSPVCFYEINGLDENPADPDPFNIFSDPTWTPLIELARDKTDRIVMRTVPFVNAIENPITELTHTETWEDQSGSRFTRTTIRAGRRTLTQLQRQDLDINTVWTLEHPVKNVEDFRAWLELPQAEFSGEPDTRGVLDAEKRLGDTGIVMIDTLDPLCAIAPLFSMEDYTVIALTEPVLMHNALEKASRWLLPQVEAVAEALPGRLWRIYGPEYASPPFLPAHRFKEYVTRYDTPMVEAIHRCGGYARIHSHGHLRDILDHIAATGCDGLDPIEPPPQGDVELRYVRRKYGQQLVLFGNIEVSDIENLPTARFAEKVATALREGAEGNGRGFVLMPGSCPYGRCLSNLTVRNYEEMIRQIEQY